MILELLNTKRRIVTFLIVVGLIVAAIGSAGAYVIYQKSQIANLKTTVAQKEAVIEHNKVVIQTQASTIETLESSLDKTSKAWEESNRMLFELQNRIIGLSQLEDQIKDAREKKISEILAEEQKAYLTLTDPKERENYRQQTDFRLSETNMFSLWELYCKSGQYDCQEEQDNEN